VSGTLAADGERRTGKRVAIAEKYVEPCDYLTLCHEWFFYDEADVVVDTVFERTGD